MHARTRTHFEGPRPGAVPASAPAYPQVSAAIPSPTAGYRPGLAGLRAVAITGVVVAGVIPGLLPGGAAVGVEIFFVVAGYLTAATLASRGQLGAADVTRFVGRRARRVLPALLTVLGGVSLLVLVTRPDALERLGAEIRATLMGLGNYGLRAATSSTAPAATGPSFLEHLWALAIGAQLTLLVAVAMLLLRSPRGRRVVRFAAVVLAVASTVALGVLSSTADVPERALYGTDTRATGFLLGVALGLALRPAAVGALTAARTRRLQALGLLALAGLLVGMVIGGGAIVWLTHGGLLLVDLLAATVIAVIVRGARLDGMLGAPVPRWIGSRSFAIYLWHWPVLLALGGPAAVRQPVVTVFFVAVVLVLGDLTYRFVEIPLGGAREVAGNGHIGASTVAVRTTAVACGSACAVALLTGVLHM